MLSQRITGLIAEAFLERDAAERQARIALVDDSIQTMEEAHQLLTGRSDTEIKSVMTDGIRGIYFGEEINLDIKVSNYISEAKLLRDLAADGVIPDLSRVQVFADNGFGDLLSSLDSAVSQYQKDAEEKLNRLKGLNFSLWLFTISVILIVIFWILKPLARRLDEVQQDLEEIAHTDPLTGCWNRRALMKSGDMLWSLAKRQERTLSVIICDIDRFKRINDTYGHSVGDHAIKEFALTCIDALRQYDVLGRFGGEEFVLILPDSDQTGATVVAERIRRALEAKTVASEGFEFQMTASFGTATLIEDDLSLQGLIDRADQALYAAKAGGRNRVTNWRPGLAVAA